MLMNMKILCLSWSKLSVTVTDTCRKISRSCQCSSSPRTIWRHVQAEGLWKKVYEVDAHLCGESKGRAEEASDADEDVMTWLSGEMRLRVCSTLRIGSCFSPSTRFQVSSMAVGGVSRLGIFLCERHCLLHWIKASVVR